MFNGTLKTPTNGNSAKTFINALPRLESMTLRDLLCKHSYKITPMVCCVLPVQIGPCRTPLATISPLWNLE